MVEQRFCPNCKRMVNIVYMGEERGAISDMKIAHYGCATCKGTAKIELNEKEFKYGLT